MKKLLSVISVLVALAVLVLVVFNPVAGIARTTWLWFLLIPVALIVGSHIYDFIKRHQARKESMNTLDDDDDEEELVEEEKLDSTKLTLSRRDEIRRRKEVAEEALAEIIAMADQAGKEVDSLTSSLEEENKKVANALKAAEAARAALEAASN